VGTTGTVWQAWDAERRENVALKRLDRVEPHSLYQLKHEFRAIAEITHENLIRLGELFVEDDAVFFTMELVDGVDFFTHVRDPISGGFREPALRRALRQLFAGLAALHARGKVHRDLKPSNVMVDRSGRVVLLDFGLSADLLGFGDRERGWIVGTPRYMAPEQVRDEPVGPAADAYAAGVMLHEALVGRVPLEGAAREVMLRKQVLVVPPLRERCPEVPEDLDALCRALLAVDPKARPGDREVLERLGGAPDGPSLPTGAAPELFVGREDELARMRAAFDAAAERPVTLLVKGESGVGKSALMHRFLATLHAEAPRCRVLRGRCYERENVPFNAVDPVVDALSHLLTELDDGQPLGYPAEIAALARVFPVLRRAKVVEEALAPQPLAATSAQELRRRAFRGLERLLARLAGRWRLVVAIDDLQWADADSLALLDELVHAANAPPLLLVATLRPDGDPGPLGDPGAGELRRLRLRGLEARAARRLAERLAQVLELSGVDADAVVREARGHPLYLLELLRMRAAGERAPGLDEALRRRAAALPEGPRRILERVALAGAPVRPEHLAEVADLPRAACLAAVDELRRGLWIRTEDTSARERLEPYHDRVREAIEASMPAATRAAVHRRWADVLLSSIEAAAAGGAQDAHERATLVHHLERAGDGGRAAAHAREAAARSSTALAFDQAAELYATALRLGTWPAAERTRLMRARAEALRDAGRGREAAEEFVRVAARLPEAERLPLELAAAEQWLASGFLDEGLQRFESILARIGVRWPARAVDVLASLLRERAALAATGLEARPDGPRLSADERLRLGTFQAIAAGLGSVDPLRAWIFQTRALRRLLRTGERDLIAMGYALEALLAAFGGQAEETHVRHLVARARALADELDDPRVEAWAELADGGTSYFLGRLAAAPDALARAERRFADEVRVDSAGAGIARILKVWTAVFRGDFRQLRRWIPDYERDAVRRDDRYAQVSLNLAGHVGWLVDGDLARARAKIAQRAWRPPDGGYHVQNWYRLMAECEQALYAPAPLDRETKRRLDRGFGALRRSLVYRGAESVRVYGTWLHGRYLLACGAVRRAGAAARRLERERADYAQPYAVALRAGIAHRRGRRARAVAELRVCVELAERNDLYGLAAMARRRLGVLTGRAGDAEAAEAFFRHHGVADPERMTVMYLPGFEAADR
jgi:hypothetical protein